MITEQTNNQATTFEDGNVIKLHESGPSEQEGYLTFDQLQERRKAQAEQLRRDRFERQALGLPEERDRPLSRQEQIDVISTYVVDDLRKERLAAK